MLDNERINFRAKNFAPEIDFKAREYTLREASTYFVKIKSLLQDLDHTKDYKTAPFTEQKKNLKESHFQSLRKLFQEFSRYDLILKIQEGNVFDNQTELLFKRLHRVVLRFEKMPTRDLNYPIIVRELVEPIINYLKTIANLTDVNLNQQKLPKPEDNK